MFTGYETSFIFTLDINCITVSRIYENKLKVSCHILAKHTRNYEWTEAVPKNETSVNQQKKLSDGTMYVF